VSASSSRCVQWLEETLTGVFLPDCPPRLVGAWFRRAMHSRRGVTCVSLGALVGARCRGQLLRPCGGSRRGA